VPNPNIINYTPEQQARLDKVAKDAMAPASDINKSWMQGVGQAGQMPVASPLAATQMNAGVNAAIANKYRTLTQENIGRMKMQYEHQSQLEEANRLQQGFNLLSAKKQIDIRNQERLMQAQREREQARASAIGSIFGAIGMAGGAYLGSMAGPMGTVIGAQA
jgi:hypothetical protein